MLRVGQSHRPAVDTSPKLWEPSGSHLGSSSLTLTKIISSSKARLHTSFILFCFPLYLKDFAGLAVLPKTHLLPFCISQKGKFTVEIFQPLQDHKVLIFLVSRKPEKWSVDANHPVAQNQKFGCQQVKEPAWCR